MNVRFDLNLIEEDLTARERNVEKNGSIRHMFIFEKASDPISIRH